GVGGGGAWGRGGGAGGAAGGGGPRPPAAPAGPPAPPLPRQHRLAIDEAAEVARSAFEISRDAKGLSGDPAVDAIAAEPHPVGGDNGAAIHQRAVVLFVAKAAPPLAGAAGVRPQRQLLDQ